MRRQTPELKVATQIGQSLNDLTLDIEQVGIYLAGEHPTTYRRFQEVAEAAKWQKEEKERL